MSEEDRDMLLYFWKEKGDVDRWAGYENWKSQNPEQAAELELLLRQLKVARGNVTRFLESL